MGSHGHSHGGGRHQAGSSLAIELDIFTSATQGRSQATRLLVTDKHWNPNHLDQYGLPPLHRAINKGQCETAQVLIFCGAIVDATGTYPEQETALHWACRESNLDAVKTLVCAGADLAKRDAHGWTPLHHLAQSNGDEAVSVAHYLVCAGADIHAAEADGQTALHLAAALGSTDMCWYLWKAGCSPHAFDRQGRTPGQVALAAGQKEVAELMQASDGSGMDSMSPWELQNRTFKRPNEKATYLDFLLPIVMVPIGFRMFGILPWYLSFCFGCGSMGLVSMALMPRKGAKPEAKPVMHAFYIGCVLYTYGLLVQLGLIQEMGVLSLMMFLGLTVALLICFCVASYTDPGVVPFNEADYFRALGIVENTHVLSLAKERLCRTCKAQKPIRSKHCSVLNRCVAEFDHFCPWCNNAVGSKNLLGFLGWCFFEMLCHGVIIYLLYGYLLKEIKQDTVWPIWSTLGKLNQTAPTVFYLFLFNCMSFLMAMQLAMFNCGNLGVGVTTNERMNANRYKYLQDYVGDNLRGNPNDKGGFIANFRHSIARGIVPDSYEEKLPPMEEGEPPMLSGTVPLKTNENFDCFQCTGAEANQCHDLGAYPVQSAEAFRWIITQQKRIQEDPHLTVTEREAHVEVLRDMMLQTVCKLAEDPPERQKKLLEMLNGDGHQPVRAAGHISDQLQAASELVPKVEPGDTKGVTTFAQPDPDGAISSGGSEQATPSGASGQDTAREQYMLAQQKAIAYEVLTAEQLEVFKEGQQQMDQQTDPKARETVMATAQAQLANMLTDIQQDKIRVMMTAKMNDWNEQNKNVGS